MDDSLYDEFGNYIGPELSDSEASELEDAAAGAGPGPGGQDGAGSNSEGTGDEAEDDAGPAAMSLVLHEDKKYYPSAEEVYGRDTETLVQEEDAQPLEVPIVAPVKVSHIEVSTPHIALEEAPLYTPAYLRSLHASPELARCVLVAGHLHHGKTSLVDLLVRHTHALPEGRAAGKLARFTDSRLDERERCIGLKASPLSVVAASSASGKSYLLNVFDAPGHVDFLDETVAAARLCDGVLLAVDAAEGVCLGLRRAAAAAAVEGLRPLLVISKMDRLIVELRLPPADAYHKLRALLHEVNALVALYWGGAVAPLCPSRGTVLFAAAEHGWCADLHTFAELYAQLSAAEGGEPTLSAQKLAARLWGDRFFDPGSRAFVSASDPRHSPQLKRSFVEFVLEPLYKIYATVLAEDEAAVRTVVEELGAYLPKEAYGLDTRPLLSAVLRAVLGPPTALVDACAVHVPSARRAAAALVRRAWLGPQGPDCLLARHLQACSPQGPAVVHVSKLFPRPDASAFDLFGRVVSGTLRQGQRVRVLGEAFTPEDEEDAAWGHVEGLWIFQTRYRVAVAEAAAGAWVLVGGLDASVSKTATLVGEGWEDWWAGEGRRGVAGDADAPADVEPELMHAFSPLRFPSPAVVRVATEPLHPGELPRMVEGLRKLGKSYPQLSTRVEESGEHVVLGTGELYLDSALKDLRQLYSDVEIKVVDPVVSFCETVVETSAFQCFAETPNRKNKLTMIAEPLQPSLIQALDARSVPVAAPRRELARYLVEEHAWDALAARSLWAFGPDPQAGPCALLEDTLGEGPSAALLAAARESVAQGFRWGAREGPLCDEPMRGVRFRLTAAELAAEPVARGGGQLIPAARRVAYSSFLVAAPRLMEPVYQAEIQTSADCIDAVYAVLAKRRGHVTADRPLPGTPLFHVAALLPAMELFGFETDLRVHTQGQAFVCSVFDHWAVVPGDPLDESIVLRPLEPAPAPALARDFMVKTRRRKGMSDTVSVAKFFDDPMLLQLAQEGLQRL